MFGSNQEDQCFILRIQKAEFFNGFAQEEVAEFSMRFEEKKYSPQTYISQAGSQPSYVGIFESGDLQMYVNIKDERIKIGEHSTGEMFLVMPYFYNTKTAIDLMTVKGCFVIEIPKNVMDDIFKKHPEKYDEFREIVDKKNKQSAAAVKKFILSQPNDINDTQSDMGDLLKINI